MPTVIRSTIARTVRAQTQTGGLSELRRTLTQTRRSSGRREHRAAARQRGREAVSVWERERERASTEECISPERRTSEQTREGARLYFHEPFYARITLSGGPLSGFCARTDFCPREHLFQNHA